MTEVDKELICKLNENYGYINTSTPLIPRQRGTGKYIMTEKLIAVPYFKASGGQTHGLQHAAGLV